MVGFLLFFFWVLFAVLVCFFFFFNDTATTEIYTLSLHDALPIFRTPNGADGGGWGWSHRVLVLDRKSTRLNSSHHSISYAVFCLKKKKIKKERNGYQEETIRKNTIRTQNKTN